MKPVPLLKWLLLFFVLQAFLAVAHGQPADYRRQPWYTYAEEYFRAQEEMVRPGRANTSFDLERFEKARRGLTESMPPNDADLEMLLVSASPEDQQVGLLNVAVRGRGWKSFTKCAPFLFSMQRHPQTRAMVYSCMSQSNPETFFAVENNFLDLVSAETDRFLLPQALLIMCDKVSDRNKAVPVFAALLKTSDDGRKSLVMALLTYSVNCDPLVKQRVIDALSRDGAEDTLRYVKEWEKKEERGAASR